MVETILRLPEVMKRTGLSRSSIYKRIQDGDFPKQIKLGGQRASGWVCSEIDGWINQQIFDSRTGGILCESI